MTLEEFQAQNEPAFKLHRFKSDVIKLRKDGFTLKQIQAYLQSNDIKTTTSYISKFLKKQKIEVQNKTDTNTSKEIKSAHEYFPNLKKS